jgi:type I restriction enzyme, R subunit
MPPNTKGKMNPKKKRDRGASYAMTMRAKLPKAFRFGFTGTPIDKTMQNTHRDFGPIKDGEQERYISYYGIRRAIKDGATLEVHYIRDKVPFDVDENALNVGFEKMCKEMELEDEEAKDFIQRQKSRWKELARDGRRIDIIVEKMLKHFLEFPDPNGFKAQLVAVDRKACVLYKKALDDKAKKWAQKPEYANRGLHPDWFAVIISAAQNSEPDIVEYEYEKSKQDDMVDYFKLTPTEWEAWNKEHYGDDRSKWRVPLKILIVCDRLLTGFDAPVEQVMYLDKPLRDHNLLQAIARTNRPLPSMKKCTGVVVDYFGAFDKLEKALNFDENIREESLIDWDALKGTVPRAVSVCMESFKGITIADTRECLLGALRCLRDSEVAKRFEQNFKSLERLWEAVSPDPCLYEHRHQYNWLCSIYVAYRRRLRGSRDTYGELAAKTRQLIQENTTFIQVAESLPVFKIDENYMGRLDDLPSASDKAAALEAVLTAELSEDDQGFIYRQLGERLQRIKEQKDANDDAAAERLRELEAIADEKLKLKQEPERLNLTRPGEHDLFTVLRALAKSKDENYIADCARRMVTHLRASGVLTPGWSNTKGGLLRVEQSLLAESWNEAYADLGFDPENPDPPFLKPAVAELAKSDGE